MKNIDYLKLIVENGNREAAKTAEEMSGNKEYHGFDSFLGLYYDLAKMELQKSGEKTEAVREFAIDKALDRIDKRLDCADFAIPALIRMLREHRGTERLSDTAAEKIQKSLIGFKYWLDEPEPAHACYFTENHQILYHSAEYLAGQLFPDAVFPSNGMTGREHKAHATEFMLRWLKWRERFGFSEWLTQGYYMEDILGLICLTVYADEETIRTRSKMLIDMLMFDMAVNGFHGHMPTTHGRVYTRFIIEPDYEDCSAAMRLCWDEGYAESGMCECAVMLAACGYECPEAIKAAAKNDGGIRINRERMSVDVCDAAKYGIDASDFDNIMFFWGMQTYSDRLCIENSMKVFPTWNWMTNRVKAYREMYRLCDEAGAPCEDAPDFTAMTEVDILTRKTPDYIISCAQDFRRGKMGYQQHPWTASLGGKAVIFTTNPASLEYANRPNRWAGNLCLPRAALDGNVLICIYRIKPDFVDYLYSHLYFPKHEMDETIEKNGFIFGRRGDGYIAVRSLLPAYWEEKDSEFFRFMWEKDWQERFERAGEYEYIAQGHANVWTVEMGSRAENGSFEEFVKGFDSAKLSGDSHSMLYRAGNGKTYAFGWNEPLKVSGKEVPLHGYKRYENEFCTAEFDAKRIEISAGGHNLTLDFENAKRIKS
ncbi:MAG: hypothetical protein PHI27_03530 [Eubacteriales bacterium]|nr:hypothetical protein [Eubacteriales bacterium]MDD3881307.1 hypothetical protein [Eubacteriales bacterium]MDD4512225.1 hypothetical protein [Eubacteriales bacterium]